MITEGMKSGDLCGLVSNVVTVGNFKSKIDDSVIVFTFEANDSSVAREIRRFIQKGYSDILDVEVSSTPNHIGNYTIFVEVENNQKAAKALSSICADILRLVDFDEWLISFNGITGVFRSKTNGIEDLFVQYVKPYVSRVNSKIVVESYDTASVGNLIKMHIVDMGDYDVVLLRNNITLNQFSTNLKGIRTLGLLDILLGSDDLYFEQVGDEDFIIANSTSNESLLVKIA